jgi:hypothetical protein
MFTKRQLLLFVLFNVFCIRLFAFPNPSTDISECLNNYSDVRLAGSSSAGVTLEENASTNSYNMTLPIAARYIPKFPYTFYASINEDYKGMSKDSKTYQTTSFNIDEVQDSESFTIKVEGNELFDHSFSVYVDYQPTFYSTSNQTWNTTIPISFREDFIVQSNRDVKLTKFDEEFIFNKSFPYLREPYKVWLRKGYRDITLLKFHFSWPDEASSRIPRKYGSTNQVVAFVGITITDGI